MGVRRSSLILFCDKEDEAVLNAKQNLYSQDASGGWVMDTSIANRTLSNNTVMYKEKPSYEELKKHFELIKVSAEPGFANLEQMRRRNPYVKGTNPCGEILLDDRQTCNLTEINMAAFVNPDGTYNRTQMLEAQAMSATIGYRMATIELELHKWNTVAKRDMLLGCSLTGLADFINLTGILDDELALLLQDLRDTARQTADKLAERLKFNKSLNITCAKPSGSVSLLAAVSAGIHFQHSPYYIRRVRINNADPLCQAMQEMGFVSNPENGQTEEDCTTRVFEFPIKSPKGATKFDVSAIRQLELYKLLMEHYVDHNASNTISVSPEEWDEVVDWVYKNWDSVVGMTFLELTSDYYLLAPYESITEEQYHILLESTPFFDAKTANEIEDFSDLLVADIDACSNGYCPTR